LEDIVMSQTAERALLDATLALTRRLDVPQTCSAMLDTAERMFAARCSWILLHDRASGELVTIDQRGNGAEVYADARIPCDQGIVGMAFKRRETVFVPEAQEDGRWFDVQRMRQSGIKAVLTLPLVIEDEALGVLGLASSLFTPDSPPQEADLTRLRALAAIAAAGIRNARVLKAVDDDRLRLRRLLEERRHLKSQVGDLRAQMREWHSVDAVVGHTTVFEDVLAQVQLVAPADSTVLLVGETGTGKELIARAIHDQSRRSGKSFIAVNCAALPEALVESELFGHEKGAFTGAFSRKLGKFELADSGTLFLDEIGDLPAEAQAKLLRVLQEREVQRVGGTRGVPVNVRLISATNQDLGQGMQSGRFRKDLFYRLSVFPIRVPPLRERPGDIPLLAEHFLRRFAERQHKPSLRLAQGVHQDLIGYDWPGNVRELQNVIERAVILARTPVIGRDLIILHAPGLSKPQKEVHRIDSPIASVPPESVPRREIAKVVRFADAERSAIRRALELSGWRISGSGGAADILGLKPTTLHAKMKRLGVQRPRSADTLTELVHERSDVS
jgi:formate hydrogenlyase transcriptional activator